MFSPKWRAQRPAGRTAFFALLVPALLAPVACTAILGDFTVSAAGTGDGGSASDGPTSDGPSDTAHFLDVVQIAAGKDHTCALRSTGEVFCWGDNSMGQLGTSSVSTTSATPVRVANLTNIRAIAAGNNHTCALDGTISSGGKVYCWGSNTKGQLGSSTTDDHTAIPQTLATPTDVVGITAGTDYTCGLDSGGGVFCWGTNADAQLTSPSDPNNHITPVSPSLLSGAREVSAGNKVTCAISSDALECWGTSNHGEIPVPQDGGALEYPTTTIDAGGVTFAHVASGVTHVCATEPNGGAICWGSNDFGESGNVNTAPGAVVLPGLVPNISNAIAIGAGESYSCALTATKYALSCWGTNDYGALGNGQPTSGTNPQSTPSDVAELTGVGVLSVGFRHACAVVKTAPTPGQPDTASGAAWCWGDNSKGQLGDGTTGNQKSTPVQVLKP